MNMIRMARVLYEDEKFMTIEIAKDLQTEVQLNQGDRFYSMVFIRSMGDEKMESWLPWDEME